MCVVCVACLFACVGWLFLFVCVVCVCFLRVLFVCLFVFCLRVLVVCLSGVGCWVIGVSLMFRIS